MEVEYDIELVTADPSTNAGGVYDCARDACGPCSSSNAATNSKADG